MQKTFIAAVIAVFLCLASPVWALIKMPDSVGEYYKYSKLLFVGSVASFDGAVAEVTVSEVVVGDDSVKTLTVQAGAPGLFKSLTVGQPVVLFIGKDGTIAAHLLDTWMVGKVVPGAKPVYRIAGPRPALNKGYPGRTIALTQIVRELKAKKQPVLDSVENQLFHGGIADLGTLAAPQPKFLLAADVNGDKKPDLLVGTAAGVKLFLADGDKYTDATKAWGLEGVAATGDVRAAGDSNGDGKIDLLIGNEIYFNDGARFTAAKASLQIPSGTTAVASALADTTGSKRLDAVVVLSDGKLLIFDNPGAAGKAWTARPEKLLWDASAGPAVSAAIGAFGDTGKPAVLVVRTTGILRYSIDADSGPPADFERLTGQKMEVALSAWAGGLKNATAVGVDVNADHRPDLLVIADGGGLVLVNRGFGTFFANPDGAAALVGDKGKAPPFHLATGTAWTAADTHGTGFDDLLVMTAEGHLYRVDNPPPKPTP